MNNNKKSPKILSLFTGAGGLDIGFHKHGFDIISCIEIDKPSCDTLDLNRKSYVSEGCEIINEDITKVDPCDFTDKGIDFIIGGPPCQSFSAAGRRAGGVPGINDTRGSLFWYYAQLVKEIKPKGFLFENVRGILHANKSEDWDIIKNSFSELGYDLFHRVMDAADFGVPQHRERVILVGVRSDLKINYKFPRPTYGPCSTKKLEYISVGEAFADIDDPYEKVPKFTGKYGDLLKDIPPGMNYSFYTERMGHPEPRFAWRSKFSGFLFKLNPEALSKTFVAHQGKYDGPFHWKNRKLNISEMKRIQGFPDNYKFIESKVETTRQIGNSVSPKLAEWLALSISKQLFYVDAPNLELLEENETLFFDKRKAVKSSKTRTITKKSTSNKNQLTLFSEVQAKRIEWQRDSYQDKIQNKNDKKTGYLRKFNLKDGIWTIDLIKESSGEQVECNLMIDFYKPVAGKFYKINANIKCDTPFEISELWDAVHQCINMSSSYSDLQPLYGHFTEPYPQFEAAMSIQTKNKNLRKICDLIAGFCEFSNLKGLHDLTILEGVCKKTSAKSIVHDLRNNGFDIRVHETNRTIPEGKYKVCYPFSLSRKSMSFVVWKEVGEHKTNDIHFIETENGLQPEKVTV